MGGGGGGGGGGWGKTAIYIFHGGQQPKCISKVYRDHNLGGLGVLPKENFLDFEHPEITPGAFLDQKYSSYMYKSLYY